MNQQIENACLEIEDLARHLKAMPYTDDVLRHLAVQLSVIREANAAPVVEEVTQPDAPVSKKSVAPKAK